MSKGGLVGVQDLPGGGAGDAVQGWGHRPGGVLEPRLWPEGLERAVKRLKKLHGP